MIVSSRDLPCVGSCGSISSLCRLYHRQPDQSRNAGGVNHRVRGRTRRRAGSVVLHSSATGHAAGGAAAEEKTDFTVVLASAGDKKIQVIKVVRELTGLGLKEAKELVEGAPKPVKDGVPKAQAEEWKKKLSDVGAAVELK